MDLKTFVCTHLTVQNSPEPEKVQYRCLDEHILPNPRRKHDLVSQRLIRTFNLLLKCVGISRPLLLEIFELRTPQLL